MTKQLWQIHPKHAMVLLEKKYKIDNVPKTISYLGQKPQVMKGRNVAFVVLDL